MKNCTNMNQTIKSDGNNAKAKFNAMSNCGIKTEKNSQKTDRSHSVS